jgi:hypothetical protein
MRLLNDRMDPESSSRRSGDEPRPEAVDPATVLALSLLAGFGSLGFVFAPAPVLLAQARLPQPWPKVVAVAGAALALLLFGALGLSPILAVFTFAVALVVADGVENERPLPWTLGSAVLVVAALATLGFWQLGGAKGTEALSVGVNRFLEGAVATWVEAVPKSSVEEREQMARALRREGPALLVLLPALIGWLSIGLAAHLRWTEGSWRYSADSLRNLRLPTLLPVVFVVALLVAWRMPSGAHSLWVITAVQLLSFPLFIQGCTALSTLLHRRNVGARFRSVIYAVSILFGFHALVAFGAAAPLVGRAFYRRSNG